MKRVFDVVVSAVLLVALAPLLAAIAAVIKTTSPGPVFFRTPRVGKDNRLFTMYKFRTMRTDTPQVATHLLEKPERYMVPLGSFLRRNSLDELPQLANVLRGEMSLVGPRPALFNQHDLIALRTENEVHRLLPGLTGWAQVNGRDDLPIPEKVAFDTEYLLKCGLAFDLRIIFRTVTALISAKGVSH